MHLASSGLISLDIETKNYKKVWNIKEQKFVIQNKIQTAFVAKIYVTQNYI